MLLSYLWFLCLLRESVDIHAAIHAISRQIVCAEKCAASSSHLHPLSEYPAATASATHSAQLVLNLVPLCLGAELLQGFQNADHGIRIIQEILGLSGLPPNGTGEYPRVL